ncbi:MAG: DoxX-like family protein [Bacteroidota bacterium]
MRLNHSSFLTFFIATVWLVNGLYCKLFNGMPRHRQIVAQILGEEHATLLTQQIGLGEVFLAIWVLSHYFKRWNAGLQILLVLIMNILERYWVPELLLWGPLNFVFALGFIGLVYYWGFVQS